ncbi:MAG TPA: L,D-transpeptidase family protein [Candidatus Binatia bacterium]|nr:L,D-transpeptidase family protein [Candidatus Binatia bacterium]
MANPFVPVVSQDGPFHARAIRSRQIRCAVAIALWVFGSAASSVRALAAPTGERTAALERVRRAPLEPASFAALANVLFREGETASAVAAANEAVRLEPTSAPYHRMRGYLSAVAGDDHAAETAFRAAAAIDRDPVALADVHLAQARAEYEAMLRHDPENAAIAERLRALAALADVSIELQPLLQTMQRASHADELVPPIVLSDEAPYALVVDKRTQTARLYHHIEGEGVGLVRTLPCTTGQAMGAKSRRGDHRTPDGAYVITDLLPGDDLPDAYGALALPLSYPNAWDRSQHRGGTGIWLHGSDRVAAPFLPRETRGCVLLRNDDLQALARLAIPGVTPVLIAEDVPYQPAPAWQATAREMRQHVGAESVLATVAAADYAVLVHRDGATLVRDYVEPRAPWRVLASERNPPIAADVWSHKLAALAPDGEATLLDVRQLEPSSIIIDTSAPVAARALRQAVADRLDLDLPGVRSEPVPAVVTGVGPWVKEVRVVATRADPATTRLMIALRQPARHRVATDGNRIIVSFAEE